MLLSTKNVRDENELKIVFNTFSNFHFVFIKTENKIALSKKAFCSGKKKTKNSTTAEKGLGDKNHYQFFMVDLFIGFREINNITFQSEEVSYLRFATLFLKSTSFSS